MRYAAWGMLVAAGLGAWNLGAAPVRAEDKGTEVVIDGLKSTAPPEWKEEEISAAAKRVRVKQFKLAKVEGDKFDGELVIFHFGAGSGGTFEQNLRRWKGFFVPPEGKTIDDVTKVEKKKVGEVPYAYVELQGTYKFKMRPFDENEKEQLRPHYHQINIMFESKKGPYFFRLTGPAKTIEKYKKGFDQWVEHFMPAD